MALFILLFLVLLPVAMFERLVLLMLMRLLVVLPVMTMSNLKR
jgi:hypothetical protein